MAINPKKRFGIDTGNDFTVWDLDSEYKVDSKEFLSLGKATPFEGWTLSGKCIMTVCDGKIVYDVTEA